jgi:hypothetical protein
MAVPLNFKRPTTDVFYFIKSDDTYLWYGGYTNTIPFYIARFADTAMLSYLDWDGNLWVKGTVNNVHPIGTSYTPRNDPTADDFNKGSLMINTGWYNLYLGGIIPDGTKAVCLKVEFTTTTTARYALFDSTADTHRYCAVGVVSQAANIKTMGCLVVPVDSQKNISYAIACPVNEVTLLNVTVTGWWV